MTWDKIWKTIDEIFQIPLLGTLLSIILIVAIAFALRWVLLVLIRRVVNQIVSGVKKTQNIEDTQALMSSPLAAVRVVQRTRTLGSVLTNVVNVVVFIVVVLLVVNQINSGILGSFALLTAALGAGLGFGAQNIVKDTLNGIFMVLEDQLGVGDVVDVGPATGIVEAVGIRITQVRDVNGTLWFVRNGEILRVGNMSQGWARVVIDLAVPYTSEVEEVQKAMLDTANTLVAQSGWRSLIVEKPEVWGLESISEDALVMRLTIKTRSNAKDDVARELRLRLKQTFDEMNVQLPTLNTVVLEGFEGALSVKGAKPPRTRPVAVIPGALLNRKRKNKQQPQTSQPVPPQSHQSAPTRSGLPQSHSTPARPATPQSTPARPVTPQSTPRQAPAESTPQQTPSLTSPQSTPRQTPSQTSPQSTPRQTPSSQSTSNQPPKSPSTPPKEDK